MSYRLARMDPNFIRQSLRRIRPGIDTDRLSDNQVIHLLTAFRSQKAQARHAAEIAAARQSPAAGLPSGDSGGLGFAQQV